MDKINALLEKATAERVRLEARGWRTVNGQVVEDLSGVRGGWTIGPGPVVHVEGGKHQRRYWPARCSLFGEWSVRSAASIRNRPDSRGCRTCLLRERP